MSRLSSILHWSRAHMQILRIAINKLFEWLFFRVFASHCGGPGSMAGTY
jgi:hypothetical protein